MFFVFVWGGPPIGELSISQGVPHGEARRHDDAGRVPGQAVRGAPLHRMRRVLALRRADEPLGGRLDETHFC